MNKILIGQKFGRLTVVGDAPSQKSHKRLRVKCICGTIKIVHKGDLKSGKTKSCGCLNSEKTSERNTIHGMSHSQEYNSWARMKQRCSNKKDKDYTCYGGRGITVCKRWRKFENFIKDMGKKPTHQHSIDRIENDGNYEPGNCKWSTRKEQSNNTRKSLKLKERVK